MISNELIIQSHRQGITLARPDTSSSFSGQGASVAQMMSLPLNLYFMNHDSVMQKMNDATADTNGYLSAQDAVGKSIRDVSCRETANLILNNDRAILCRKKFQVVHESFTRLDECELTALSIKFPWYADEEVIGILGCSILLGMEGLPSLSEALTLLMQTGLLAPAAQTGIASRLRHSEYTGGVLDQRDTDILYLLVRGKTAKNIARQLQLSHRTVEHRLEVIKQKLKVSSKSELIEKVIDQFVQLPEIDGS